MDDKDRRCRRNDGGGQLSRAGAGRNQQFLKVRSADFGCDSQRNARDRQGYRRANPDEFDVFGMRSCLHGLTDTSCRGKGTDSPVYEGFVYRQWTICRTTKFALLMTGANLRGRRLLYWIIYGACELVLRSFKGVKYDKDHESCGVFGTER